MEAGRHPAQPRPGEDQAGVAGRAETELSEDGMSKFTPEWIRIVRSSFKMCELEDIHKEVVFETLDEIIRLQETEQKWIPVGEADLQTWQKYIVVCKSKHNGLKTYTVLAQYFPPKTVLEEDFIDDQFYGEDSITEYDEENDCYWVKEGWFEYTYEGEMGYRLSDEVVMVMPFPQPPKDGKS